MNVEVHFAGLRFLWAFLFIIGALACYWYRLRLVRHTVAQFSGAWQSIIVCNYNKQRQILKGILYTGALLSLFFALMRPQWGKKEQVVMQSGRDVLIALDISKSMLAKDCYPNRLSYAKKKIKSLLKGLESDRVGLLLFSGSAFVQCPLTTDYSAFHMFLDHVDAETISSGSTALDVAIQEGIRLFSSSPATKNKVMIVCTDGEDFSSNLSTIKEKAQKSGVILCTLGVGTSEGAPIPLYDNEGQQMGHQKDSSGAVVISKRNDGILSSLARDMGGVYVPVSENKSDITLLLDTISRMEKEQFEDKKVRTYQDQYQWFAFTGLLCLLAEWLL